jgi:hypothetical protein
MTQTLTVDGMTLVDDRDDKLGYAARGAQSVLLVQLPSPPIRALQGRLNRIEMSDFIH